MSPLRISEIAAAVRAGGGCVTLYEGPGWTIAVSPATSCCESDAEIAAWIKAAIAAGLLAIGEASADLYGAVARRTYWLTHDGISLARRSAIAAR
jgi:hypothetical protein